MLTIIAILFATSLPALPAWPAGWLQQAPTSLGTPQDWTALSVVVEVAPEQQADAKARLSAKPFVELQRSDLARLGVPSLRCPTATKPYLVRALFTYRGTGKYYAYWAPHSVLVVAQGSLGALQAPRKSALVTCLPGVPKAIYGLIWVAQ